MRTYNCPRCDRLLELDVPTGSRIDCPGCGQVFHLPPPIPPTQSRRIGQGAFGHRHLKK